MLNNTTLLALYKQEKADMYMPSEDFPSFKEWKAEYAKDWEKNHTLTDAEKALEEADRLVAEADKELNNKRAAIKKTKTKTKKKKAVTTIKKPVNKKTTKKQIAINIYKSMMVNNEHPSRQDVIRAFMTKANMTQAGASTYAYNIKKELS